MNETNIITKADSGGKLSIKSWFKIKTNRRYVANKAIKSYIQKNVKHTYTNTHTHTHTHTHPQSVSRKKTVLLW